MDTSCKKHPRHAGFVDVEPRAGTLVVFRHVPYVLPYLRYSYGTPYLAPYLTWSSDPTRSSTRSLSRTLPCPYLPTFSIPHLRSDEIEHEVLRYLWHTLPCLTYYFRSDEIEHEVLDTFAPRLVMAGWWH